MSTARKTTKPAAKAAPAKRASVTAVAATPTKRGRPSNAEKAARIAAAAQQSLVQQVTARYDAAGQGRRLRGWSPPSSGPNVALQGIEKLRDRSRDTTRNDWSGASGVQKWTTNLVGTGIVPRITRIKDVARKIELIDLWNRWSRKCNADAILDFYGMQTLAVREWIEAGEVFVRLRWRRMDSGMEVPLQLQLIPAEYVPMLNADYWPGMPSGNRIRSGIELRNGQRVAYWVHKEHPRDGVSQIGSNDLIRVLVSDMLHVYEPKRAGQLRGVPENAPVLVHLREVADYDGNVRERMRLSNLFAGFIERPGVPGVNDGTDPLTGQPIVQDTDGSPMVSLEPGIMHELLPGEKVTWANPPEPGTIYPDYMRVQDMRTAAGRGIPYELLSGDIKEVSDRTLRVLINDFRRYAEQRQHQIIVPQMCQPIREAFTLQAAIMGLISDSEIVAVREVVWQPQAWPYIHPVQDVQAKREEVDALFRSRSSVQAERGDDPELVDQEIADDQEREHRLGIERMDKQSAAGAKKPDGDNIPPGEYPRNRSLDNLTASVARLETRVADNARPDATIESLAAIVAAQQDQMAGLMASVAALAQSLAVRPLNVEPAKVTVTNEIPAPVVNVEPAKVTVTNEIPAPVVNVEPAKVTVTNEVQPADVVVDVKLPERQTTSLIERDKAGNIVSVTQNEKTVE